MQTRFSGENEHRCSENEETWAVSWARTFLVCLAYCLGCLVISASVLSASEPVTSQLLGQWPGYNRYACRGVSVIGSHLFAATGEGGLVILDVTEEAVQGSQRSLIRLAIII
ncbi:MAG: hypothetical protein M1608_04160, partial [Candidatus Omnitrophica bacterium]|nr:hypothetical protein [Candidatus Omnitrophota bacterium]